MYVECTYFLLIKLMRKQSIGINCDDWLESSKSIEEYKWNHTTSNLAMTFHKPVRVENMYICFGYGSHNICNQTQGKVSG